jgi:DNA polymerase-3 subunit gamma/tau
MSYLVLARKYRPQTFDEVIGQPHVTQTLTNAIGAGRVAHAILFTGPRGTGKTTVARILAKSLNCLQGPVAKPCNQCRSCNEITGGHAADVFEIDGASNNSVDQVRELRENLKYMPAHSKHKIYIIDEVHMLSNPAFNALLKTLEEPPPHVQFVFATTEPRKIPTTILSRCQRYDFKRIKTGHMIAHMETLCELEAFDISTESLGVIAGEAGGSMRDALSILDQVMACASGSIGDEQVVEILGIVDRRVMRELAGALMARDIATVLDIIQECYSRGHDIKKLYGDLVRYFRNLLVLKLGRGDSRLVDLPDGEMAALERQTAPIDPAELQQLWEGLFKEEATVRLATQPRIVLEMVLIRLCRLPVALSIETLIEKLDLLRREIAAGGSGPPSGRGMPEDEAAPVPGKPDPAQENIPASIEKRLPSNPADDPVTDALSDPQTLWEKLMEVVAPRNPALAANLKKCRLTAIEAHRLKIEIGGNHIVRSMIQRDRTLAELQAAFKELLDGDREIVLTTRKKSGPGSRQKKKIEDERRNQALNHPLVADAIQIFDGTLMDVKLR